MIVQLVVASGSRAGQMIPVAIDKFIIGRAADCHLRPTSELISRYHCALLVGDEVVARDLGSRNGVRLNGEKINAEQKINNGDKLSVGPLEFFVRIVGDDAPGLTPNEANAHWTPHADAGDGIHADAANPTIVMDHMESLDREQ